MNAEFNSDIDLSQYDSFHKINRVNRVYLNSLKPKNFNQIGCFGSPNTTRKYRQYQGEGINHSDHGTC